MCGCGSPACEVPRSTGNSFYERLNRVLDDAGLVGTPRSLQGRVGALVAASIVALSGFWHLVARFKAAPLPGSPDPARIGA